MLEILKQASIVFLLMLEAQRAMLILGEVVNQEAN